jgi:uncharacterized membrane protein
MPEPDDGAAERLKHARALELEMIKATAAYEHAALKPPFVLNGGALAVYLALYSALSRIDGAKGLDLALAKCAWISWLVGLAMATLATIAGFRSQFAFRKSRGREVDAITAEIARDPKASSYKSAAEWFGERANRSRKAALVFGLVSLIAFAVGVALAFASLKSQ